MSFNRRGGPDRRPDRSDRSDRPNRQDRYDRPPQGRSGGDWQPRERPPYQPRGDRPYPPRPRAYDRPPDEGAMSIRLDPRRVNALKHLAGEAGVRPGDLVRQWVEERIDASRGGAEAGGDGLTAQVKALAARVAALESATAVAPAVAAPAAQSGEPPAQPEQRKRRTASARPSGERVALHDEMIAIIAERGPMSAGDLAQAISERGRYAPPRSGKPLDAAMVSQRVSNPTYRARFTRDQGRIGLAE